MNQTPASQLPGQVIAVNYNGTYYYYLRNAQGDVVKLIDKTGTTVVEYTYDSWGKLLSTTGSLAETFGTEQPFRYRSYVYDEETGWYYLKSRYYNPELGRFISADVYLSTGQGVLGHNAYAYCLNNPVNGIDPSGSRAITGRDVFIDPLVDGGGGAVVIPLPGIDGISTVGLAILTILALIGIAESATLTDAKVEDKTLSNAIYYGAFISNDAMVTVTDAMNFSEAIVWVSTVAISREILIGNEINSMGRKRKWGLYTPFREDAFDMAFALGGMIPIGPELSEKSGYFWHYHTFEHDFWGRYKHFHVWYGSPQI